jgi:hypothetical protein
MDEKIHDVTIISPCNQREMIAYQGLIAISISSENLLGTR